MSIALCTYLMVDAVNRTGCNLHVKPLIMGLIFLAAGTSVPDALGSIAVAKQGEGDMAVANAFGSNVFDILLGLGVPWLISTTAMQRKVVFPGAGGQLIEWILILTAILVLFLGSLIANKWKLNRQMGFCLMGLYVVYVIVALIRAFALK
jgi:Ca2+/Na+ antiporter